ncbi:MAG: hypothetical protein K0Q87_4814 [Neobacillus sp.]|jgi:hypothetical protein|nr:hypothetical protein [Neobacillus sp.]
MLIKKDRENFYILNWLDEYMTGHKGFIAGGCFKNIFCDEKVKDLDIFFESQADYDSAIEYFDGLCGEENKGGTYCFYYESKKVKAYKNVNTGIVVELINTTYGNPIKILENFDFTIAKFAYFKEEVLDKDEILINNTLPFDTDSKKKKTHIEYKILCDSNFFEHLHLKRLVTDDKILFPVSTFERMIRYVKYGYLPCKETKLKIIEAIRQQPDTDGLTEASLYEGMD